MLSQVPFLRPTLAMVLGIVAALLMAQTNLPPWIWYISGIIILLAIPVILLKYKAVLQSVLPGVFLLILFILLGFFNGYFHPFANRNNYAFSNQNAASIPWLKLQLTDDVILKSNTWRSTAKVISGYDSNRNEIAVSGNLMVYWPKSHYAVKPDGDIGAILLVQNKAIPIPGAAFPNDFDFRSAMRNKNMEYQIFLTPSKWVKSGKSKNFITNTANGIRNQIITTINANFKPRIAGLLQSLLIGYRSQLEKADVAAFAATGTMHVLAVSGMHAGLVYMLLILLFTGKKRNVFIKKWQGVLIILILWSYAFITGLSPSVIRAVLMFSILECGRSVFNRPGSTINALFASAFLQLLINPLSLLDVGFQLSYLAVLGILLVYPYLASRWMPPTRLLQFFYQSALISISATITTLPVTLFFFHSFPLWFILANMLIVPISTILIFAAIACLTVLWIPLLSYVFIWGVTIIATAMLEITGRIAMLPNATIAVFRFDVWMCFLLLGIVFSALIYLIYKIKGSFWLSSILSVLFGFYYAFHLHFQKPNNTIIVAEIRNHFIVTHRFGDSAIIYSAPISTSGSDSLFHFFSNWCNANGIQNLVWEHQIGNPTCHGNVKISQSWDKIEIKSTKSAERILVILSPFYREMEDKKYSHVFVQQRYRKLFTDSNRKVQAIGNAYEKINLN